MKPTAFGVIFFLILFNGVFSAFSFGQACDGFMMPSALYSMLLSAQEITIRVPLSPEETDIVTFDSSRVSPADVKRWILLSEHNGPYGYPISFDDIFWEPGYQKYQKGRERK